MAQYKVGDRVRVAEREAVNADLKSGLYYSYFANMVGKIERTYDDNTVCVDVEMDSLPEDVRERHIDMQTAARDKWIAGLPQEQRNRLSEADKQFKMSYKILVAEADVSPFKGSSKSGSTSKKRAASEGTPEKQAPKAAGASAAASQSSASATTGDESSHRLTQEELEAKELEYLKSLEKKQDADQEENV